MLSPTMTKYPAANRGCHERPILCRLDGCAALGFFGRHGPAAGTQWNWCRRRATRQA